MLRTLSNSTHISPTLLLASTSKFQVKDYYMFNFNARGFFSESGHRPGALLERAVPWWQQDGDRQFNIIMGRQEGMDQGWTDFAIETHV